MKIVVNMILKRTAQNVIALKFLDDENVKQYTISDTFFKIRSSKKKSFDWRKLSLQNV